MAPVVTIHSFRGGTGKSNLTANLAVALALMGKRIGAMDLDLRAPGLHVVLEVPEDAIRWRLNDYLWDRCKAEEMVCDLTQSLGLTKGSIHFIPASFQLEDLLKIVESGYDVSLLSEAINGLAERLELDMLLLDTHPGIDEDILLCLSLSDHVIEVLRLDQQDLTGAYISMLVASKLGKRLRAVVNMVPKALYPQASQLVGKVMGSQPIAVIPLYEELMVARSKGVFLLKHPDHPLSSDIGSLASKLFELL